MKGWCDEILNIYAYALFLRRKFKLSEIFWSLNGAISDNIKFTARERSVFVYKFFSLLRFPLIQTPIKILSF